MLRNVRGLIELLGKSTISPALGHYGYTITSKMDPLSENFPKYYDEATKLGYDVNDWLEKKLGWVEALPVLKRTTFPYLQDDSIVCELGIGTGRWSRHLWKEVINGELHLVDHSPWLVDFVREYFPPCRCPNVYVHLCDGSTLPFQKGGWVDVIFSEGLFVALKLGKFYTYSQEFFRVLKPGGYCVLDYIDITTPQGWNFLETEPAASASTYSYHTPQTVDRIFSSAGFEIVTRHQIDYSSFLVIRRPL